MRILCKLARYVLFLYEIAINLVITQKLILNGQTIEKKFSIHQLVRKKCLEYTYIRKIRSIITKIFSKISLISA